MTRLYLVRLILIWIGTDYMTGTALNYFLLFITSMITTLLLVPPIKHLAHAAGVVDKPNERKVHRGIIPRMGGLAMFFGCILTCLIYMDDFEQYRGIYLGMFIIVIVGLIDDSLGLDPKLKFMGQIVAAMAAMVLSDVNISFMGGVLGSNFSLGWLSWPLTLFWIVGITNAINLSDGLDGLAGGISLIAFTCFGILAYQRQDYAIFMLCLVLTGSILGFLKYNSHPAEIFMGDTGSLFLGYCLGTFSIAGYFKSLTTMTLITPVLVLLVPIADTLWAIVRRIREGRSPFSADKRHFHHKLLNKGMDQTQTVTIIYAITGALSISAVILANAQSLRYLLLPMLICGASLFFAQVFGVADLSVWTRQLSRGLVRSFPFHTRSLLRKLALRLVQLGAAIYALTFALGLVLAPVNMVFVALITVVLVGYLAMTRGQNGHDYMIFSLFFLAAVIVLITSHMQSVPSPILGPGMAYIEPAAIALMTVGVIAKIIFQKTRDILLSTPMEFFIFLVLISIAIIPEDIRGQYNLAQNTLRTFLLFLALKIIVLKSTEKERAPLAAVIT